MDRLRGPDPVGSRFVSVAGEREREAAWANGVMTAY
jgi:hypothetical protein